MKIRISKKQLASALKIVAEAVPVRSSVPAYMYVKVTPENGVLTLSATDGDFGISLKVKPIEIKNAADPFLLDPKVVAEWLDLSGSEEITINGAENKIEIGDGSRSLGMPTPEVKRTHDLEAFQSDTMFTITPEDLSRVSQYSQAPFRVRSTKERLEYYTIFVGRMQTKIACTSMCGKSSTICVLDSVKGTTEEVLFVNKKVIAAVVSSMEGMDPKEPIKAIFNSGTIKFVSDGFSVVGRLIEGKKLPVDFILTKYAKNLRSFSFAVKDFKNAIQTAAIVLEDKYDPVKIEFSSETEAAITSKDQKSGASTETFFGIKDWDSDHGYSIKIAPEPIIFALSMLDAEEEVKAFVSSDLCLWLLIDAGIQHYCMLCV